MSGITLFGKLLAATDDALTYLMLPFGQQGSTNKGKVTASKGSVTIPEDLATTAYANLDHDPTKPAAKFTNVEETDEGLVATFRPLMNTWGRDLLVEAHEGVRTGVSVELDNPIIRDGALLGGVLCGAGFTSTPAFPDAQLIAADAGELTSAPNGAAQTVTSTERKVIMADAVAVEGVTLDGSFTGNITMPANPAAPAAAADAETPTVPVQASSRTTATPRLVAAAPMGIPTNTKPTLTAADVFARLNAAQQSGDPNMLKAAVDQAVYADVSPVSGQGSWLGETFARRDYPSKYVPLFEHQELTGMKATGWRFDNDAEDGHDLVPDVDDYAGYNSEPASEEVKTKAVSISASRLAGYNEYDRAVDDFPADFPGFWEGFFREQQRNLDKKMDAKALAHLVTAANYTAVTATDLPTNPAQDLATAWAILDGISAISDIAQADFAVIPRAQWANLVVQREQDKFANLGITIQIDPAQAAIEGGILIVPSSDSTFTASAGNGGKVLVGSRSQHTIWAPKSFRAQTVNVGNGGNTVGLFAYYAMLTRDPRAFALVTIENDAS